jgi:tetratricopeptide (TPR) repeat protein
MRHILFVLILTVDMAGLIPAETLSATDAPHSRCELWGQVVSYSHLSADGLEIELAGSSQTPRQRTHVADGVFDFQPVPPGKYQFKLFDRSGHVILRYTQLLRGSNDEVILRLPYDAPTDPSSTNVVSLAELNHQVPRKAHDAFRAGLKAVYTGDAQKSLEYFQKAVALDSQYVEAENNLAVLDNGLGRREEALQHAQRAYEISPGWAETGHTLAVLLLSSKRYVQAEELARAMLANQQAVPEMHAVLAVSLIGQRRNLEEAFRHLRLASADYPEARLRAANALIEIGLPSAAAIQVNGYLRSGAHECERATLERWITKLDQSESKVVADAR